MTLEIDDLGSVKVALETSEQVARRGGTPARVWRSGRVLDVVLPPAPANPEDPHAEYRTTAAPLFLGPPAPTPALERDLGPGSWLAVLRAPGRVTQRATFVVPRGGRVALSVALPRVAEALPDFVHVPPGEAEIEYVRRGAAPGASPLQRIRVGGFWILDREITTAEFLEFLDSPDCPASRKTFSEPPSEMHGPELGLVWNRIRREAGGRSVAPGAVARWPVNGVSADDAEAFVAWLNASARRNGSDAVFAIPTDVELLRAACGDDGRPFPYGHHFGGAWQKTAGARPALFVQEGRMFPVDESPFGVFDLLGSESEWCRPTLGEHRDHYSTFGGSFQSWSVSRLQAMNRFKRDSRTSDFGFRIVVRDR
jgi:formylglycine-generating enzyme required for sulfatase activity